MQPLNISWSTPCAFHFSHSVFFQFCLKVNIIRTFRISKNWNVLFIKCFSREIDHFGSAVGIVRLWNQIIEWRDICIFLPTLYKVVFVTAFLKLVGRLIMEFTFNLLVTPKIMFTTFVDIDKKSSDWPF